MRDKNTYNSKIERLGLKAEAIEMLFTQNMSPEAVQRKLAERGIDITNSAVRRFKESMIASGQEFAMKNKEEAEKVLKGHLDTLKNLNEILIQIKTKIEQYKDTDDWKAHSTYISEWLHLVEITMKRLDEWKPVQLINTQNVQINMKQVYNHFFDMLDEAKTEEHEGVLWFKPTPEFMEQYRKRRREISEPLKTS